jgi:hypothetical protein
MPPYDFAPGAASCVGTFIASSPARVSAGDAVAKSAKKKFAIEDGDGLNWPK